MKNYAKPKTKWKIILFKSEEDKTMKVKVSTIARIGALLVALANQCLALFGRDVLPFTDNAVYQFITVVVTVLVAIISAWKNNDITSFARTSGKVLDALKDGKITKEEVENLLKESDSTKQ